MPIIALIFWLAVIGLLTYLVLRFVPMPDPMKKLIVIAVVVLCVVWILNIMGVFGLNSGPNVPRIQ